MIQIQDALGLGSEGRMNQPGSVGAWGWRLSALPSADVAARLRAASEEAGRGLGLNSKHRGRGAVADGALQLGRSVRAACLATLQGDPSRYGPRRQWEIVIDLVGLALLEHLARSSWRIVGVPQFTVQTAGARRCHSETSRMPGSDGAVLVLAVTVGLPAPLESQSRDGR